MADRTAAALFGKIFELLAKNPTEEHKSIAQEIFQEIEKFDFEPKQMYADKALIELELKTE